MEGWQVRSCVKPYDRHGPTRTPASARISAPSTLVTKHCMHAHAVHVHKSDLWLAPVRVLQCCLGALPLPPARAGPLPPPLPGMDLREKDSRQAQAHRHTCARPHAHTLLPSYTLSPWLSLSPLRSRCCGSTAPPRTSWTRTRCWGSTRGARAQPRHPPTSKSATCGCRCSSTPTSASTSLRTRWAVQSRPPPPTWGGGLWPWGVPSSHAMRCARARMRTTPIHPFWEHWPHYLPCHHSLAPHVRDPAPPPPTTHPPYTHARPCPRLLPLPLRAPPPPPLPLPRQAFQAVATSAKVLQDPGLRSALDARRSDAVLRKMAEAEAERQERERALRVARGEEAPGGEGAGGAGGARRAARRPSLPLPCVPNPAAHKAVCIRPRVLAAGSCNVCRVCVRGL